MHDDGVVLISTPQLNLPLSHSLAFLLKNMMVFLEHLQQIVMSPHAMHRHWPIGQKTYLQLPDEKVMLGLLGVYLQHILAIIYPDLPYAKPLIKTDHFPQGRLPVRVVGLVLQKTWMYSERRHCLQPRIALLSKWKLLCQIEHARILSLPSGIGSTVNDSILECLPCYLLQLLGSVIQKMVMRVKVTLLLLHYNIMIWAL